VPQAKPVKLRAMLKGGHHGGVAALSCALLLSCADKSDITLTANLSEPRATVAPGVFGFSFTGDCTLVLQVGGYASDASTVTVETFSLNSENQESLVAPLDWKPVGATLPFVVAKGSTSKLMLQLGPTQLTESLANRICTESIVYVAAVSDSLAQGRVSEVRGQAFMAGCAK